jgi:hypothetical protein
VSEVRARARPPGGRAVFAPGQLAGASTDDLCRRCRVALRGGEPASGQAVRTVTARRPMDLAKKPADRPDGVDAKALQLSNGSTPYRPAAQLAASPSNSFAVSSRTRAGGALAKRERQTIIALTRELEDTNRGVVALYAEIEEKAERSARPTRNRASSNTSHELRTPLSSIHALACCCWTAGRRPSRAGARSIHHERRQRPVELVNDLLDLAKIEAGKVDISSRRWSATCSAPSRACCAAGGPARELIFEPGEELHVRRRSWQSRATSSPTRSSSPKRAGGGAARAARRSTIASRPTPASASARHRTSSEESADRTPCSGAKYRAWPPLCRRPRCSAAGRCAAPRPVPPSLIPARRLLQPERTANMNQDILILNVDDSDGALRQVAHPDARRL